MPEANAAVALSPKIRRRQSRTRQRILEESARMFIDKGFENVSVEEIIEAAEIARSSFYRFFSNREQVLANIIRPVFEQGVTELQAIESNAPAETMSGVFETYLKLWQANPDALRVSARVGGSYFYLFQDVHQTFREKLEGLLKCVEASGIFLNDSARNTGRLLARTVVSVLEVYSAEPNFEPLFHTTMAGFLLKTEIKS